MSRFLSTRNNDAGAILTDYTLYSFDGRHEDHNVSWWIRNGEVEYLNFDYVRLDEGTGIRPAIWVKYSN